MEVHELNGGDAMFDEAVDDLDEELVEFLSRNGANFEMVKTSDE